MKKFLIAASIATAMLGFAPAAMAQDMRPGMNQPNTNDGSRRDSANGRAAGDNRQMDRGNNRRDGGNDRMNRGDNRSGGWHSRDCHKVRRHHRWMRVCGRR
jgi:hypothetical protein